MEDAEAIRDWQKHSTPNEVIAIVSGNSSIGGITKDYRDYDWSEVMKQYKH